MHVGKGRASRKHAVHQSIAVFGMDNVDVDAFMIYGRIHHLRSKSVPIDPENASMVNEMMADINKNKEGVFDVDKWLAEFARRAEEKKQSQDNVK